VASFKVYAFVICGILPIFKDYIIFYLAETSPSSSVPASGACVFSNGHVVGWYEHAINVLFLVNWAACWGVLWRYKHVRKMHHADGVPRVVETGDKDSGDWEVSMAIKYDAFATAFAILGMGIDYLLRFAPAVDEDDHACAYVRTRLWLAMLVRTLSQLAAPFVLFKLPGLGPLVHGLRPTAYDASGNLRLAMSLADARRKYEKEKVMEGSGSRFASPQKLAGSIGEKVKKVKSTFSNPLKIFSKGTPSSDAGNAEMV